MQVFNFAAIQSDLRSQSRHATVIQRVTSKHGFGRDDFNIDNASCLPILRPESGRTAPLVRGLQTMEMWWRTHCIKRSGIVQETR
jgi:hypothetical protein